jgi:adenylate cyclase
MFANMRGFTQMAQTLNSPENTQNRLNEFLTMLAEEVIKHNGLVNKFLGDGLIVLDYNSSSGGEG